MIFSFFSEMSTLPYECFFETVYFLCIFYLLWKLKNYFRAVFLALNLPGPFAYPVIGNALTVRDHKSKYTNYTKIVE